MVFCGKPSRGCQMCRTRRIKCDETKPTCNQCAKSRRICPGYKDEFDLVFRNETKATERRARKANRKAMARKLTMESKEKEMELINKYPSPVSTSSEKSMSIITSPHIPIQEQATCHFISNWVLLPRHGSTRGFMEYVVPLLNTNHSNEHFRLAFEACALASLGNRVGPGSDCENLGLAKYTKALAGTNRALQDPGLAKHDSTLAAILLLGLFENLSAKQLGMLAWGSHVEGAIQLVKARGRDQLKTKLGVLLFIAVRTQMIIHTLTSGQTPIMTVDWWMTDAIKDESAASCQRLNIHVGELRAEVNTLLITLTRSSEDIAKMADMIRRCQILESDLDAWTKNLPDYFDWKTVAWEDNVPGGDYSRAEVFPGRVDAYRDLWVASVWNMLRCSRIILASLIVRCAAWMCAPLDYRTTPEYALVARTCADTIGDIVASVPFQLGWFSTRTHLLERANLSSFGCGQEDALKGLPGYFLTWPLTCVLSQDYATDNQRAWVKGRLEFIASELGVRYAHMLTKLNLRIPSMLIRQDGRMAMPTPAGSNFEKYLSGGNNIASASTDTEMIRRAMEMEERERRQEEMRQRAVNAVEDWMSKPQTVLRQFVPEYPPY